MKTMQVAVIALSFLVAATPAVPASNQPPNKPMPPLPDLAVGTVTLDGNGILLVGIANKGKKTPKSFKFSVLASYASGPAKNFVIPINYTGNPSLDLDPGDTKYFPLPVCASGGCQLTKAVLQVDIEHQVTEWTETNNSFTFVP